MKQKLSQLIIILIVSFLYIQIQAKRDTTSKAAKFVALVLREFKVGKNLKSLEKSVKKLCPKLKTSQMISNIKYRLYKMKKGLKKLDKHKNRTNNSKSKRRINRIKRNNVSRLLKAIYKRIWRCILTPSAIARKMKLVFKTIKKVHKRKCKGAVCKLLRFKEIHRITRAMAYLAGIGRINSNYRQVGKFSYVKKNSRSINENEATNPKKQSNYDFPRIKVEKKDKYHKAFLKRRRLSMKRKLLNKRSNFLKGIAKILANFVKNFYKVRKEEKRNKKR